MKKQIFFSSLLVSLFLSFNFANPGWAQLKAPASQTSDHWVVNLGKPIYDKEENMLKAQPGVFETYSIDLKNTGSEVQNLTIQVFRIKEGSEKIELITQNIPKFFRHNQEYLVIKNVPIPSEDKELEVLLTWETKGNQTKKQSLVFNETDLGLFPE